MAGRNIPGVTAEAKTDLPVLLPYDPQQTTKGDELGFSRWLASLPPWSALALLALIVLWPAVATAQSKYTYVDAFGALWKWLPSATENSLAAPANPSSCSIMTWNYMIPWPTQL